MLEGGLVEDGWEGVGGGTVVSLPNEGNAIKQILCLLR